MSRRSSLIGRPIYQGPIPSRSIIEQGRPCYLPSRKRRPLLTTLTHLYKIDSISVKDSLTFWRCNLTQYGCTATLQTEGIYQPGDDNLITAEPEGVVEGNHTCPRKEWDVYARRAAAEMDWMAAMTSSDPEEILNAVYDVEEASVKAAMARRSSLKKKILYLRSDEGRKKWLSGKVIDEEGEEEQGSEVDDAYSFRDLEDELEEISRIKEELEMSFYGGEEISVNDNRAVEEAECGVKNAVVVPVGAASVEEEDEAGDDTVAKSSEGEEVSLQDDGVERGCVYGKEERGTVERKVGRSNFQQRMEKGSVPEMERSGDEASNLFNWSFGVGEAGETGGSPRGEMEKIGCFQVATEAAFTDIGRGDTSRDVSSHDDAAPNRSSHGTDASSDVSSNASSDADSHAGFNEGFNRSSHGSAANSEGSSPDSDVAFDTGFHVGSAGSSRDDADRDSAGSDGSGHDDNNRDDAGFGGSGRDNPDDSGAIHDDAGRDEDEEEFFDCGSLAEIKTEFLPEIDDDVQIVDVKVLHRDDPSPPTAINNLCCPFCCLTLTSSSSFRRHLAAELEIYAGKRICPKCRLNCGSTDVMIDHFYIVHGGLKKYICSNDKCVEGFWMKEDLLSHERSQH